MMPLVSNPSTAKWKKRVFSQYPRGYPKTLQKRGFEYEHPYPLMGYTMRTDQYRYTEWVRFSGAPLYKPIWNESYGTELYDHQRDPEENWNRADDPDYKKVRVILSQQLHAGWRAAN